MEKNGYTLYVRDNSFLGFPAYHLYIPGLSEIDGLLYDVISSLKTDSETFYDIKPEFHLQGLSTSEKKQLIQTLERTGTPETRLFLYNSNSFNRMNRQLLLALLYYSIGDNANAYQHMDIFLEEKNAQGNRQDQYYYCIRDMFYAKTISNIDEYVYNMLSVIYTEQLVNEVLTDMADKDNVFKNFPFSICFDCNKCRIRNNCSYLDVIRLEQTIMHEQGSHIIDQHNLYEIFFPPTSNIQNQASTATVR